MTPRSTGRRALTAPIVGIAATPSGHGYWLVAADGGVFTFGDATFHGSTSGHRITAPSAWPGYWLAAYDGGVFTFGDASSAAGPRCHLRPDPRHRRDRTGSGYWPLVAADGSTDAFGHARAFLTRFPAAGGSTVGVNAIAAKPNGGYVVASSLGTIGVSVKRSAPVTIFNPPPAAATPAPVPTPVPTRPPRRSPRACRP